MARWLPVVLEGLRRALPWVLERLKGNGTDTLPAVRQIRDDVQHLHERFEVQEEHLAALWSEMAKVNRKLDAD